MKQIEIVTRGTYSYPLPEGFNEGLAAEIQKHMEGYGLKNVTVRIIQDAPSA